MTRFRMRLHSVMPLLTAALIGSLAAAAEMRDAGFLDLPRSEDDRGFSILLMSPTDLFLTGRQTLRIEAIIPRGDAIEQVDFFLDGHIVATDRRDPYETPADFGREIRRHTIEIRAITRAGRRAKVSLVTRSGDIGEGSPGRILAVPVVARQPSGSLIDDLGVSDFTLFEDGEPRSIAYFAPGPFPASIAVVADPGPSGVGTIVPPLAAFLRGLPTQDATALVEAPFATAEAASAVFSFDPGPAIARLATTPGDTAVAPRWEDRVRSAAVALGERRGLRVLVVVRDAGGDAPGRDLLEDPAGPALEAALATGATVYALIVGAPAEQVPGVEALRDAASRSGGGFYTVADGAGLGRALAEAGAEIRHRYLLGFMPSEGQRAGWRAIQVRLRAREAVLRAPRSVFLP